MAKGNQPNTGARKKSTFYLITVPLAPFLDNRFYLEEYRYEGSWITNLAPKLASSIVYPDTFEKRIGLDLSSGHPSQKRIGLDLSRLGRAGKRLFLSQSLSRTEAKTEVTVIIALPRPAPVAATFGDQLITRLKQGQQSCSSTAPLVGLIHAEQSF